jgi:hypothetical protein
MNKMDFFDSSIEAAARIIDPDAFGVDDCIDQSPYSGGYLTDRDIARQRAIKVLKEFNELLTAHLRLLLD